MGEPPPKSAGDSEEKILELGAISGDVHPIWVYFCGHPPLYGALFARLQGSRGAQLRKLSSQELLRFSSEEAKKATRQWLLPVQAPTAKVAASSRIWNRMSSASIYLHMYPKWIESPHFLVESVLLESSRRYYRPLHSNWKQ